MITPRMTLKMMGGEKLSGRIKATRATALTPAASPLHVLHSESSTFGVIVPQYDR